MFFFCDMSAYHCFIMIVKLKFDSVPWKTTGFSSFALNTRSKNATRLLALLLILCYTFTLTTRKVLAWDDSPSNCYGGADQDNFLEVVVFRNRFLPCSMVSRQTSRIIPSPHTPRSPALGAWENGCWVSHPLRSLSWVHCGSFRCFCSTCWLSRGDNAINDVTLFSLTN